MIKEKESPANDNFSIAPEFMQFLKQLAYMRDWLKEYTENCPYVKDDEFPMVEDQLAQSAFYISCFVTEEFRQHFYFKGR
jgi:hypothetical protein